MPPVLTREVFCSSIHDDSAIDRHAQFFPDGGEMPEEIWSRSHSRFDLYEGGATALRSVYEVDFALVGIAVEVQLAVFVLVEVSLHGFRNDEILEHITALGVVQQLFRRMNPEKIVERTIVVEIDVVRR